MTNYAVRPQVRPATLVLLIAVLAMHSVDRQIIGVLAEPIKSMNSMVAKLITSARTPALDSLLTAVSARQVAAFKVLKQEGLGLPSRHPLAYVSDPSGVVFKQLKSSACMYLFKHVDILSTIFPKCHCQDANQPSQGHLAHRNTMKTSKLEVSGTIARGRLQPSAWRAGLAPITGVCRMRQAQNRDAETVAGLRAGSWAVASW